MERTTRKQLENMVYQLNVRLNRPIVAWSGYQETLKSNVGHFMLDCNPTYGGYQLNEIVNEQGGEKGHFSGRRFSASEMWWLLYAVRECTEFDQFKAWPKRKAA